MIRPEVGEEDFEFVELATLSQKLAHVKHKLRAYEPLTRLEQAWLLEETNVMDIKLKPPPGRPPIRYGDVVESVDELRRTDPTMKKETAYKVVAERINRSWQVIDKAYRAEMRKRRQRAKMLERRRAAISAKNSG